MIDHDTQTENTESMTIDNIINTLKKTPAKLHLYDSVVIPYSLHPDHSQAGDVDVEIDRDENTIKLYNLLSEQYDLIPIEALGQYEYYTDDAGEVVIEETMSDVNLFKQEIQSCIDDPKVDRSEAEIVAILCDKTLALYEWNVLKKFNLRYTMDQLRFPDDEMMSWMREHYMDLIRNHRESSLIELDQLEKETKENDGTQDDLDDIDTIKQMFRDIPQDVDLTKYTTIHELYQFWPSLLLPKPKDLLTLEDLNAITPIESPDTSSAITYLRSILQQIDDPADISKLLVELGDIKSLPEGAYEEMMKQKQVLMMIQGVQKLQ